LRENDWRRERSFQRSEPSTARITSGIFYFFESPGECDPVDGLTYFQLLWLLGEDLCPRLFRRPWSPAQAHVRTVSHGTCVFSCILISCFVLVLCVFCRRDAFSVFSGLESLRSRYFPRHYATGRFKNISALITVSRPTWRDVSPEARDCQTHDSPIFPPHMRNIMPIAVVGCRGIGPRNR
jgi:hypothetical protein